MKLAPYLEYKDSGVPWLGKIPSRWGLNPGLAAFREKQVKNTGMRERTVLSLSYGKIVVKPTEKLHGLVPESFETYQIVEPGDIIIRSTDLQNDWNSLRVGLVRNRGIITSAYICLKMTGEICSDYGFHLLHSYDLKKVFYGLGSGLRQNLAWTDFKRMPILVPHPDEQTAIVRFLAHSDQGISHLICTKRRLIELLTEQKRTIIHRAVTRGLKPNVPLKPTGIPWLGNIPLHWDFIPLKFVSEIQSGITLGKKYANLNLKEYSYLRVANVQAGHLNLKKVKTIRLPVEEAQRSLLQVGDVLMTEGGDPDKLGRGCVWEGEVSPCLHQNHVFAVRTNRKRLRPQFLAALLTSNYAKIYFLLTAKQTTNLASTNKSKIGRFQLLLPKLAEQDEILIHLSAETRPVNEAIARTQREIELIREYRTRLVADVVTGQLDVRAAAANLPAEPSEVVAVENGLAEADDTENSENPITDDE